LDLVVFQRVEVDPDPHHAGPELRVAEVLHAAAVLPVVQHHRRDEPRALQVDHEPGRIGQREVLDVDRASELDHDLHAAGRREHADGPDLAVSRPPPPPPPPPPCPPHGPGCPRPPPTPRRGPPAAHSAPCCLARPRRSPRPPPA